MNCRNYWFLSLEYCNYRFLSCFDCSLMSHFFSFAVVFFAFSFWFFPFQELLLECLQDCSLCIHNTCILLQVTEFFGQFWGLSTDRPSRFWKRPSSISYNNRFSSRIHVLLEFCFCFCCASAYWGRIKAGFMVFCGEAQCAPGSQSLRENSHDIHKFGNPEDRFKICAM